MPRGAPTLITGPTPPPDPRLRWLRILVFYSIAIGLSALARLRLHTNDVNGQWPTPAAMAWYLFSGAGPFLGALAVWAVFHPRRTVTFTGTNSRLAWLMLLCPAAVLALFAVPNPYGLGPHLFGACVGLWIALYALLEETGWRGYLQDELRDIPLLRRCLLVGLFWYPWHLTFLQHHSLATELAIAATILAASVGIGVVADRTRSVAAAAAFHLLGNILGLTSFFTLFVPTSNRRLLISGLCLAALLFLFHRWRHATA